MLAIIKKLLKLIAHVQVLAVILAFALMAIFSNRFISDIERRHLLKDVNNAISNTQAYIEADLMEPETTLGVYAQMIRYMILNGSSPQEVGDFILNTTNYLKSDERLMSFITGTFGFFDVFDNYLVSGIGWMAPPTYDVKERPWYKAAVDAKGEVGITEPYIDIANNVQLMTFARQIFDDDGNVLGIVCMNIMLDRIRDYAINTDFSEYSYGILMDKDLYVIAHPEPSFLGRNIIYMYDGVNLVNDLIQGKEVSEKKVFDYNGNESVFFVRRLKNGWYLGIMANSKEYYRSVNNIAYLLIALASIFAAGLSAILLSIISGRKRAEERTQIMLDAVPLCANFWDGNLKIIDCNHEALKLFEVSTKQEYLAKFSELSPEYQPDGSLSSEKTLKLLDKAYNEGYCRFEWQHRKLNGEIIPCEVTLVRVKYRNKNIVCGYTRDLREMKYMMAKMHEADECTKVLLDTTPLSCFMMDNTFKILECNQEIVKLFGLSDKQAFIDKFFTVSPEYQPSGELSKERFYKYIDEAFEEGYCRFEWMHQNLEGDPIPTEVSLVRVKFKGVYAVAGYIRDLREIKAMIAEMRRAEIAEESNKAKSEFLAKMSHEIRTPMNAILGITEIQLQDPMLPIATKEALGRIYNSGDLLLGIINDILDLSKIEAGKLELVTANYDVASMICDIVQLNRMRYENKPIEFKLNVSDKVPAELIGDVLRIKQILNNILSNAYKYTNEGLVTLSVLIEPEEREEGAEVFLIFSVTDTGQGMTEDQVKRLGEKYSRFNMEANRTTEGTGLGMNITKNLIQMMDGEMLVESEPGKGSKFTIRLPQKDAGSNNLGRRAENLERLDLRDNTKVRNAQIVREFMPYGRVLVVDDVETNLYVARGLLAPYGLSIDTALSGYEAIDKVKSGSSYDIIFMDHMMPKMDGIETTKNLRELGYKQPIIALTANALAGQEQVFMNSGFDGFVSKPIDSRQMNMLLNELIRDKQPPDVLEEARQQKNTMLIEKKQKSGPDTSLAEIFVRDAQKALSILETVLSNKCRRSDDLSTFIINIHAMKSALANIGEKELSDFALKLEQAGRDNNTETIMADLPAFLDELRIIIERISPKEDDSEETVDENEESVRMFLREQLLVIQMACLDYDKKVAKEALAELKEKQWSKAIKERLNILAECLLHSDFDEAVKITEDFFSY